jgi:fatty-acyl-CoA synthase
MRSLSTTHHPLLLRELKLPKSQIEQTQTAHSVGSGINKADFAHLRTLNLWQMLEAQPQDNIALIYQEEQITYRSLIAKAAECAAGLAKIGIQKGDKVAVVLPNWIEYVVAYFACARLGAIFVPLNIRYRTGEMEFFLQNINPKALIACTEFSKYSYLSMWREIHAHMPQLKNIIVLGEVVDGEFTAWAKLIEEGATALSQLPELSIEPGKDPAVIIYTSGSTGTPKAVLQSHAALLYSATTVAELLQTTPNDRFLGAIPLFYCFGNETMLTALSSGASLVLLDIFSPENALEAIQKHHISVIKGVPTTFLLELHHPNLTNYDLSSIRAGCVSAAPTSFELIRRVRTQLNCNILSSYGMTETTAPLTSTNFNDDTIVRARTVGRALPGVELKIVDENHEPLAPNSIGELVCRSPGLMLGYYNNPAATALATDKDGWFYTGDLATIGEDGLVKIIGRKKDMINRGGFKIFPREVEELYHRHPKVREVSLIGVPDPELGEKSCLCVQLEPGQSATEQEMCDYLAAQVPDYKVPDLIYFVTRFPLTASGKIKRMQLKKELGIPS